MIEIGSHTLSQVIVKSRMRSGRRASPIEPDISEGFDYRGIFLFRDNPFKDSFNKMTIPVWWSWK
jgi:hypothetical protein